VRTLRRILVVVMVAASAGALSALPVNAQDSTVKIKIGDNYFKPKKKTAVVGDKITFKWTGAAAHNIKVKSGPQKFGSGIKSSGTFSRQLKAPGKYRIVCTIHPGMEMTLTVNPAPVTTTVPPSAPPAS